MKVKIGICQMNVTDNKIENLKKAKELIINTSKQGCKIAILPEMFCCPYDIKVFSSYAESFASSNIVKTLQKLARDLDIYIYAGSIPELSDDKIYNTCFVIDNKGDIIGVYRKKHLFDMEIEGKVSFKESAVISAGKNSSIIKTEFFNTAVLICFDLRFMDEFKNLRNNNVSLIVIPASFNMTTGPDHWELLLRSRALDTQSYIAAAAPARNVNSNYVSYSNSMIINPWGSVIAKAGVEEKIITATVDTSYQHQIKKQIPLD